LSEPYRKVSVRKRETGGGRIVGAIDDRRRYDIGRRIIRAIYDRGTDGAIHDRRAAIIAATVAMMMPIAGRRRT
jgi:hypothetical protein